MYSVRFIPTFLKVVVHLCIFIRISDSQTTPFDEFVGVSVPDQTPEISNEAQKVYTTTVDLEKFRSTDVFVETTFQDSAALFYANALGGFISVSNVVGVDRGNNIIRVTYDATFAYPVLLGGVNGDDSVITSTIGSFDPVRIGLNNQVNILSLYPVRDDATAFSFAGSSMCDEATCNGTYVTCTEAQEGIVATCVSQCKTGYCGDDGICSQSDKNLAPTCVCTSLPDLWIIGEQCETKIALWLVVLLAVIGFLIILLVIFIVIICVIRKRRKKRRKRDLLNSVPKTYDNNGYVKDENSAPAQIAPREPVVPVSAVPATLEREDSFETVTESEIPPSEYRPRSESDRRSYASSAHRHHHHHHRHRDRHHHHHHSHDRRRRSRSSEDRRHRRSHSPERDRHQRRSRSPSVSSTDSGDSTNKQLRERNLSYYEIDVSEHDLETDAASSVAGSNSTKTSPIKWLPPKNDNQLRPGWVPSLGPMMYELPTSEAATTKPENAPPYESIQYKKRRQGGTDV